MIQLWVGFCVSNALIIELSELWKQESILSALQKSTIGNCFPILVVDFWQQACRA